MDDDKAMKNMVKKELHEDPILCAKTIHRMREDWWDVEARERASFPLMRLRTVLLHENNVQCMLNDYSLIRGTVNFLKQITKDAFEIKERTSPVTFILNVLENLSIKWAHEQLNKLGFFIEAYPTEGDETHPTWKVFKKADTKDDFYTPIVKTIELQDLIKAAIDTHHGKEERWWPSWHNEEEAERSIFLPFDYTHKPSISTIGNPTTFMEHLEEYATAVFGQNIADGQKDQLSMYHRKTPRERKRHRDCQEPYITTPKTEQQQSQDRAGIWPQTLRTDKVVEKRAYEKNGQKYVFDEYEVNWTEVWSVCNKSLNTIPFSACCSCSSKKK